MIMEFQSTKCFEEIYLFQVLNLIQKYDFNHKSYENKIQKAYFSKS